MQNDDQSTFLSTFLPALLIGLFSTMDQDSEPQKPTTRPPDLSGPPELSKPTLSGPSGTPPPDLKMPDLAPPPPSLPPPSFPPPPSAPAPVNEGSFAPPPVVAIPESAKKKVKEEVPDPDEVKAGDLAPFNTRIIAAVIDYGAVIIASIVLGSILPSILSSVVSLAALGYILTKDSLPFLGGQSIGKKVMKLRAVTADGKPLTGNWEKGVLRNAFLIIAPVELVVLLLREEKPEKGRRLGDDFAKTKVIVDTVAVETPEA